MAEDFENLYGTDQMDDGDLRDLVCQELGEYPEIDRDLIDVTVTGGHVKLSGRVGTEQEYQQIEAVVTDVLGLKDVTNELLIDELVRGERLEAADSAVADTREFTPQTGEGEEQTSDTAEHLLPDTAAEQFGVHDTQRAIAEGYAYEAPDRPIQEGTWSLEDH